jgi:hypothetical protein
MKTIHLGIVVPSASFACPESLTATSDGTIYAGSLYEGGNFRVPPGATTAEQRSSRPTQWR